MQMLHGSVSSLPIVQVQNKAHLQSIEAPGHPGKVLK